ncbi:hypothetical protein ACTUSZ_10020 [Pantoea eucalypti]|jgi:hypothetical protein|uniref:hypothetical protein n=1 Tax=Pantoea TaxID=53335 RepID=UPI0002A678C0|nr:MULTISPECIES: hypothetical protein [Pantoea]ELP25040.1 hypothetical protein F385_1911 [Pantoea agglomerans 299R]MDJ0472303.1 hypothetical protein [Pantoea eucalypti]SJZ35657.1 hypothetical protein SAMN03097723_0727 [Pantoea eucalypti]
MEKRLDNNGYIDFPFPATRNADGSVNPCGFDLTLETGRLEEIAVLNRSVNLRRLVEEINLQEGLFMTLACDWQQQADAICGFIDVAFRPDLPQHGHEEALQLEASFYRYLAGQEKQHQMPAESLVNYARSVLDWSWSPLRQRQRDYEKITIQFYCPQADDAEWCFDHLRHFLVSVYPACVAARSR